jgi:hypothetical protein
MLMKKQGEREMTSREKQNKSGMKDAERERERDRDRDR